MKRKRGRPNINVLRALELRGEGLTWREIGIRLAEEEGRAMPYQACPVAHACDPGRGEKLLAWRYAREARSDA